MGLLTNKIDREELKPGDHIYSWRKLHLYAHHGIYMGDGMVIHFKAGPGEWEIADSFLIGPPPQDCKKCCNYRKKAVGDERKAVDRVTISCLDCFLAGGKLQRFGYSVSTFEFAVSRPMTCTTAACDPPERVLERTNLVLRQGFGQYNVAANNCEDFAYYCKTGNHSPPERSRKIWAAVATTTAATAVTLGSAAYAYDKYRNKPDPNAEPKSKSEDYNTQGYY